jgi:hypothetical protein
MLPSLAIAVILAAVPAAAMPPPQSRQEGVRMAPSQIVEYVKQKKRDMVSRPGVVGPDAVPALLPLLDDPDPQVRELTVHCLDRAGGPAAAQGLMTALNDRIETISAAAVRGLAKNYTPAEIPALRVQMARNTNEYVREEIALLLGKTGDPSNFPALAARKAAEKDEHALHAVVLAMARLGDTGSRSEVRTHLLQSGNVALRVATLQDLPYVNDRPLLAEAAPLLDDQRPGLNIGPSHGPYFMRVCDVLVMVMGEMLGPVFSFDPGYRRFTPEELAQARHVLSQVR